MVYFRITFLTTYETIYVLLFKLIYKNNYLLGIFNLEAQRPIFLVPFTNNYIL